MNLEQLEAWFEASSPRAHAAGVSMMDGFVTGIVVAPCVIPQDEWLWHVMGDHAKTRKPGSPAGRVAAAIIAHHDALADTLARHPTRHAPLFMRSDDGVVDASDWADGFFGAIRLRPQAWTPILARPHAQLLMPIFVNCTSRDGSPVYGPLRPALDPALIGDSWRHIRETVSLIRGFLAPARAGLFV